MFGFLKKLFSTRNEYIPNPQATPAQKFALATSAVLTEINGNQNEWLHGDPPNQVDPMMVKAVLSTGWGVDSREQLLETISWIETEGHRKEYEMIRGLFERKGEPKGDATELIRDEPWAQNMPPEAVIAFRDHVAGMFDFWRNHRSLMGWDFSRAIWLCRWGAVTGLLSEEEAWQRIFHYAAQIQRSFSGWQELGENYRAGYNFWSDEDGDGEIQTALKVLNDSSHENSAWNLTQWNTPLS